MNRAERYTIYNNQLNFLAHHKQTTTINMKLLYTNIICITNTCRLYYGLLVLSVYCMFIVTFENLENRIFGDVIDSLLMSMISVYKWSEIAVPYHGSSEMTIIPGCHVSQ